MSADEFDIIAKYFAPLAGKGARGLIDDVATLDKFVLTTDAIVEGVHFLPDDPIDTVAKKALRVNLSDLAAKGAKPLGVLLTLIWPSARPSSEIAAFARGFSEDLQHYGVALLGGDTTSTPGPLIVSITAIGEALGDCTPSRADAKIGEQVWVTGQIGDSYLGLQSLTSKPDIIGAAAADQHDAHAEHVRQRYRLPEPPVAFAPEIARFASASMDVSDGLSADAAKLAAASNVALRLYAEAIPLSSAGHAFVARGGPRALAELCAGGDDYQALFTAAPEHRYAIMQAGRALGIDVALIGDVVEGEGVQISTATGEVLPMIDGHRHKLGS